MPDSNEYLQGFGLTVGNKYGSYTLTNISIAHKQEVLFNEYSYPIDVTLENTINPSLEEANIALKAFYNSVSSIKIIYTSSGRPYKCTFHYPLGTQATITQEGNYAKIHYITTGYGKRIGAAEVSRIQKDGNW